MRSKYEKKEKRREKYNKNYLQIVSIGFMREGGKG